MLLESEILGLRSGAHLVSLTFLTLSVAVL